MAIPLDRLEFVLADMALSQAASTIRERTGQLIRSLVVVPSSNGAEVYAKVYFATYYHEGRPDRVLPRGKQYLFYPDPRDDPRVQRAGGYPEFEGQLGQLTRQEMFRDLARGVLIWKHPGDFVKGFEGNPFFSNTGGMAGFQEKATPLVAESLDVFVKAELGELLSVDVFA